MHKEGQVGEVGVVTTEVVSVVMEITSPGLNIRVEMEASEEGEEEELEVAVVVVALAEVAVVAL